MNRILTVIVSVAAVLAISVGPAFALTNEENFAQFKFNYNTPGARALGVGGAFIAIADDATASEANPAGLIILERPEVSLELKVVNTTTSVPFNNTGTASNPIVIERDFDETVISPSFISFVYPLERVAFAIYRQELIRFEQHFFTEGSLIPGSNFRLFPVQSDTEIDIENIGLSTAFNLTDTLSTGISLRISRFDIDSQLSRYDFFEFIEPGFEFSDNRRRVTTTVNDSETDYSVNAGLLWRPNRKFSVGAVYRSGPEFTSNRINLIGPGLAGEAGAFTEFTFKVPDSYGLGIAFRPMGALTFSFDAVRIEYSDLLDEFQIVLGSPEKGEFEVEDGTEYHAGAEYVFMIKSMPTALRGGVYLDPDHRIHYTGANPTFQLLFPEGDDEMHYTFGFGIVPTGSLQLDFAGNIAEDIQEYILSTVYRF